MHKFFIKTALGYEISISEFKPNAVCKAAIFIASATGVKQALYYKFAQFLSEQGFVVYTFDYGGIGDSLNKPLALFQTSASLWAENDAQALVQFINNKHHDLPLFAIGHSIGGQLLGLIPSNHLFDGVLLVATQTGYWRMWKGTAQVKMAFLWYFIAPLALKIYDYFPGKILGSCENLPKGMAMQWRKWCMSKNYLFDDIDNAKQSFKRINCPIVCYSAADDWFAPENVVNWLSQRYENANLKRVHLKAKDFNLKSIGHFGFFRSDKQVLWQLYLDCIKTFLKSR